MVASRLARRGQVDLGAQALLGGIDDQGADVAADVEDQGLGRPAGGPGVDEGDFAGSGRGTRQRQTYSSGLGSKAGVDGGLLNPP
ncbi:MAG: hypothetical protein ACRDY0_01660 [Acidimicrobiales bacterium]